MPTNEDLQEMLNLDLPPTDEELKSQREERIFDRLLERASERLNPVNLLRDRTRKEINMQEPYHS